MQTMTGTQDFVLLFAGGMTSQISYITYNLLKCILIRLFYKLAL